MKGDGCPVEEHTCSDAQEKRHESCALKQSPSKETATATNAASGRNRGAQYEHGACRMEVQRDCRDLTDTQTQTTEGSC